MDGRPIGIFDSGLGGLTVTKEIIKLLPFENIIYLGDTARVPYGTRSGEIITKFSLENAEFLLGKKVKCLVIACNTSSAVATGALRKKYKLPIFEVITDAAKKALEVTQNMRIGVVGTRATIVSHCYRQKIKKMNYKAKVIEKACPLFVPFIEEGKITGSLISDLCREYLNPLRKERIDTLILGCTHYPLIARKIKEVVGRKVKLVSCGKELALSLKKYLAKKEMFNNQNVMGTRKFFVTDLNSRFESIAKKFLGQEIKKSIQKVSVGNS